MMADDNTITVYADLDLQRFQAATKKLDGMVASIEQNLDSFEKKQEDNARRAADAANRAADAQDRANKKISDSADAHSKKQSQAIDRTVGKFRSAAFLIAGAVAGIVVTYKKLSDAATKFGDDETIARFEAMDTAVKALEATVLSAGLEFEKTVGAVQFFTGVITTATQAVSLAIGGLVYLANVAARLPEILKAAGSGGDALKKKLLEVQAASKSAADIAFMGAVTALERSLTADAEKEANKQREKTANNIKAYNEKIRDLQIKSGESILDAERDYRERSAEAWQSYMEKVADITKDGIQKRADLARDYSDKLADAETDYQRGAEDAAYNHGKRLADIERDYQQRIRDIQTTYKEDALDAVRNLDAIGLIRARERRDKDLVNAEQSRNEANASESENYSRQLYELQRALDDKRREAELAYQRGLEDQKRAEAQALQDAKNAYNQQTTEAAKAQADKLAAIQRGYANENAAAQAQYGYSQQAYRNHLIAMQAIAAQYGIIAAPRPATSIRRRQGGGLDIVSSPTQFLAGEAGPELVYTAPLSRAVPVAVPQVIQHTGDFQHSIDSTIRSSVAGIDGRITAAISKVLREVLG